MPAETIAAGSGTAADCSIIPSHFLGHQIHRVQTEEVILGMHVLVHGGNSEPMSAGLEVELAQFK